MKNFVGAALIIIGLGLVITEGDRASFQEEYAEERNEIEADRDPDVADPDGGTTISVQPVLGIVFILGGAAVLIYAYNQGRNGE